MICVCVRIQGNSKRSCRQIWTYNFLSSCIIRDEKENRFWAHSTKEVESRSGLLFQPVYHTIWRTTINFSGRTHMGGGFYGVYPCPTHTQGHHVGSCFVAVGDMRSTECFSSIDKECVEPLPIASSGFFHCCISSAELSSSRWCRYLQCARVILRWLGRWNKWCRHVHYSFSLFSCAAFTEFVMFIVMRVV